MIYEKVLVVTRKTRLESLIERFNTLRQAQFYIEMSGGDFADYLDEHQKYTEALGQVKRTLSGFDLKPQYIDRSFLPSIRVGSDEIVITVGQDGLVANTAKYVGMQPIIALNPDPSRFDGVLLPFHYSALSEVLPMVNQERESRSPVTLGEVTLNDGQRLIAFNDFYLGRKSHVSSRYRINYGENGENQSSSGVIVSTGAGSTGWLSSIFNMAAGVLNFTGGEGIQPVTLSWQEKKLLFAVREPFVSKHSQAELVMGQVSESEPLSIESHMPQDGVIFSDGIEGDYLEFNSGRIASFRPASHQAQLVTSR